MKRQVILLILDGWGIGAKNNSNPIYIAGTPYLDELKRQYPLGALQASGVAVGLPWGEEGNSEVGHLTIGAGKVLYQHYPRITLAIKDGSLEKNSTLQKAFAHVQENQSALNFIGLLTDSNIHASIEHLLALITLAQKKNISKINLHLFSDGKDSQPRSVTNLLKRLPLPAASISGRFYALDRDNHWDRTQKVYNALVGNDPLSPAIEEIITANYQKGLNDQFIEPHLIGPNNGGIQDGDAIIFFDFREDGTRQLVEPFTDKNFNHFPIKPFKKLFITTMTQYSEAFKIPVLFPPEQVTHPLSRVLSEQGKSQLRIAETEKYAHITYFFNGLREEPFPNEYRVTVPSLNIPHQDERPEMMASEIANRVSQAIIDNTFDCVIANFANGDIIAHTGNYDAALKAVHAVDQAVQIITQTALANNAVVLITSDHGNLEKMLDPMTAQITTGHDASPVPLYLVGNEFQQPKRQQDIDEREQETIGILSDVAPTILALLGIPKPPEMTGQNLLPYLK
ncbi:MAG TPA: 2,3-bisphosphoglycerate-independent phosphoglycerate mutase [Candidatus Paceibacterota bacterium]